MLENSGTNYAFKDRGSDLDSSDAPEVGETGTQQSPLTSIDNGSLPWSGTSEPDDVAAPATYADTSAPVTSNTSGTANAQRAGALGNFSSADEANGIFASGANAGLLMLADGAASQNPLNFFGDGDNAVFGSPSPGAQQVLSEKNSAAFPADGPRSSEAMSAWFSASADSQSNGNAFAGENNSSETGNSLPDSTETKSANPSVASTTSSLTGDSDPAPSLAVDATNPAHVTFTVSGVQSGYSGAVTFTDALGTKDTVPIESNGAYSANLSNLASGTIDYTLSVSDAAGNVITVDPPLNLGDGSANAPAGTPQFPTLLNGYAKTPSWNVAGVNYAVGIPSGSLCKIRPPERYRPA